MNSTVAVPNYSMVLEGKEENGFTQSCIAVPLKRKVEPGSRKMIQARRFKRKPESNVLKGERYRRTDRIELQRYRTDTRGGVFHSQGRNISRSGADYFNPSGMILHP